MRFLQHRFGLSLTQIDIPKLIRRQLGWVVLGLLLTVTWSFQPVWAHRPHDVVTQVKLSPNYRTDQTLYVVVRGNLLKSVDKGNHWQRLVRGLDTLTPFSTLTVDQAEGRLLALGTYGDGIFVSDDAGQSWRQSNNGLETLDINLVYSLPSFPEVMLAASKAGGLFQSVDRGQTWRTVTGPETKFLALSEADGIVWAGDKTGHLLRSNDQGQSWQSLLTVADAPVTAIAANGAVIYVATASKGVFRIDPQTLDVVEVNKGLDDLRIQDVKILPGNSRGVIISSWDIGVSISLDSGETWTDYPQGLIKDKQADEFETNHFAELAVSDNFLVDQTVFLAGFNGLYRSVHGGQRWKEISTLNSGVVVAMAVSPNYAEDQTLALTTYVGKIMITHDQGKTWDLSMKGAEVPRLNGSFKPSYQDPRRFFDIVFSPNYSQDKTLFTTGLWTKFLRSTNGAKSWSLRRLSQETRGLTLLLSPNFAADKTVYIGNQAGSLFRSTNKGKTFTQVAAVPWNRGNDSPSMVISPGFANDRTLYMVGDSGVYQSTDAGETWKSTTKTTPVATAANLHVEISPDYSQDKTLYVSSYSGLFKTTDAGKTWRSVAIADVVSNRTFLEGVALSPSYSEDGTVIVSVRGKGLYKSVDKGESFMPVGDPGLAFSRLYNVPSAGRPVIFSPNYANDKTIFGFGTAATDIYQSTNGGQTWNVLATPDIEPPVEVSRRTRLAIAAQLYRGKILKSLLALGFAIAAYATVTLLRLDKIIKLNRRLFQLGVAMGSFAVALALLLKIA